MMALLTKPAGKLCRDLADVYAYEWNGEGDAFFSQATSRPFSIPERKLEYIPENPKILVVTYISWIAIPNLLSEYHCDVLPSPDVLDVPMEYDLVVLICPRLVKDVLETLKVLKSRYPSDGVGRSGVRGVGVGSIYVRC